MSRFMRGFMRMFSKGENNQASTNVANDVHARSESANVTTNKMAIHDEEMDRAVEIQSNDGGGGGGHGGFAEESGRGEPMSVDVLVKNETFENNAAPLENESVSTQKDIEKKFHEDKPAVEVHEGKADIVPVVSAPVVTQNNTEAMTSVPMSIDVDVKTETEAAPVEVEVVPVQVVVPLVNESVDKQRDLVTKFFEENSTGKVPEEKADIVPAPVVSAPVVPAPVVTQSNTEAMTSVPMSIDVDVKTETEAPVVPAPVVSAPVVPAPVVSAPVVPAPVVSAPVVPAPVVSAPVVPAQVFSAAVETRIIPSVIPHPAKNVEVVVKADVTAPPVAVAKPSVGGFGSLPPDQHRQEKVEPTQRQALNNRMVKNRADGYSFKVCDMNRLKRFIVLGSEHNTYYSTPGQNPHLDKATQNTLDNIQCIQNLLRKGRHDEILDTITQFSIEGRVAKEEPILAILALCAGHEKLEVQKAAYTKVVEICNIPTKLFRFLELTQDKINCTRKTNPPQPQKTGVKRKRIEKNFAKMEISEAKVSEAKRPSTNSTEPPAKKKKKKFKRVHEFKKVNKKPKKSSGWGRLRRKTVSHFYADSGKSAARLVYLMTKYKHRHGWTHKDVLRFAHPQLPKKGGKEDEINDLDAKNLVMKYCTHGYKKMKAEFEQLTTPGQCVSKAVSEVIGFVHKLEEINSLTPGNDADLNKLLDILSVHGERRQREEDEWIPDPVNKENNVGRKEPLQIVREHIPTGFLNNTKVWEALLVDMPMMALIRNLGKMSSMRMFDNAESEKLAVDSLLNVRKLKIARIHPMKILLAMKTYEQGHGEEGKLEWRPNKRIVEALDKAFYLSFKQPEVKDNYRTGKNYMLCLDVSGSMTFNGCKGCELITPAIASVAMAWVTWNVEDHVELVAFGGHLVDMKNEGFRKDMLLTEVLRKTRGMRFGSTDCSLPMIHALKRRLPVDVFIVYTDSDTWAGRVHPVTALKNYNREMGRVAKLIVLGMDSSGFTIADPQDPNMMDIVGFDANVPELIAQFAKGNLSEVCGDKCEDCRHKIEAFGN